MKVKKLVAIGLMFAIVLTVCAIPPTKAQFVISWDYPDEYGQGINRIRIYENSTGSWVFVEQSYYYDELIALEWELGIAIKIHCFSYLNSTLILADDANDGKNYFRHNVTVENIADEVVYSKQNFTYYDHSTEGDPIWMYEYRVVLDFLPLASETYYMTIFYEVYY